MGNRIATAWLLSVAALAASRDRIGLDGAWQFRTDPQEQGRSQGWERLAVRFPDVITVPGCWQAQGFGEPSGILRRHYAGAAWYRRTVTLPAGWRGRRIVLRIGGALRDTDLFVNGTLMGGHSGMSAPFEFDVTAAARPGVDNVLALRVSIPKGSPETTSPDAQMGTEPTGMVNYVGNWGGIYGHVELEATSLMRIDEVAVVPDVARSTARFRITVASNAPEPVRTGLLRVEIARDGGRYSASAPIDIRPDSHPAADVEVAMPGAQTWAPEHPFLYTAAISLLVNGTESDRVSQRFGMRNIETRRDVLLLNGKPLYLRGFGDDNIEVLTGTPPPSKEIYLQRLRLAKSFGFNAVRFHSMTPMPEYFEAADETGILVMAELPAAYTMYFLPHKDFLREELRNILRVHRNHPSLMSLALGNELNPEWVKDEEKRREFFETVSQLYRLAKTIDPTRVVLATDGVLLRPTDMASVDSGAAGDVPTVRHEFGKYYCSLPDYSLRESFKGVIAPVWLDAKQRWAERQGLQEKYPVYLRSSQHLQQLGRKYQIEKVRRDNDVTGYTYWLIVDYPGGTGEGDSWEEGWFDYFWTPKGITPEEGRELNSAVLTMIDAGPGDRTLWADAGKTVGVWISNYGDREIREGTVTWRIATDGRTLQSGRLPIVSIPLGKVARAGEIAIRGMSEDRATQVELTLDLEAGGSKYTNRWSFWSFPRSGLLKHSARPVFSSVKWSGISRRYPFVTERTEGWEEGSVLIASALDRDVTAFLEAGGRVLLLAGKDQIPGTGDLKFFPSPGGAIGTVILNHPALEGFPHGEFCDLQFYNLSEGSAAIPFKRLTPAVEPIIGGVRTAAGWLSEKKDLIQEAQLFEARVGRGRLLATTLRVRENLDDAYPEVVYFFDRLLRRVVSDDFDPKAELTHADISKLVRD